MKVRVGIPKTGGALVRAARERSYPVLFSANAFAVTHKRGEREGDFKGFSMPDPIQFHGLDAALDSAGFVAAVKYGDYRWDVASYYDLVASHDWAWHASMDYCCEPEIAEDRPLRLVRIAATAGMLGACRREARFRGVPDPMPVIQGWRPDEYQLCANLLPVGECWPDLVGIGSVCRRDVQGQNGILEVLRAVDAVLPEHVKVHLFGVKSSALAKVVNHPRVASMDSMAWDFQARVQRRTGRTMEFRIDVMEQWAERQNEIVNRAEAQPLQVAPGVQTRLFDPVDFGGRIEAAEQLILEALTGIYMDLLVEGAIEYRNALWHLNNDSRTCVWMMRGGRMAEDGLSCLDEVAWGLSDRARDLLEASGVHVDAAQVGGFRMSLAA